MEKVYVFFLLNLVIIRNTNLNIAIGLTVQIRILFLFGGEEQNIIFPSGVS